MIRSAKDATEENLAHELDKIAQKLGYASVEQAIRFPRFVQIETIRHCNAKCPFCAVDQWDMSVPRMSDDLFTKIVDELADYTETVRWVNIQRAGEPLLDKRLPSWIKRVKDAGIRMVTMSTNASLLTEAKAKELLEAGLDELMISIDSVDKESYEALRVGLDYETVLDNIRTFFALRDRIRPETAVRVRGVLFTKPGKPDVKNSLNEWEAFWEPFRKPQDRIYMREPHSWGNEMWWEDNIPSYEPTYHPCTTLWASLQITTSGKVALCTDDVDANDCIGDVSKQSMSEVWQGKIMQHMRLLHATGRKNEIERCVGCRTYEDEGSYEKARQHKLSR